MVGRRVHGLCPTLRYSGIDEEISSMITMTARHAQRPSRSGKSPCQAPGETGQLPAPPLASAATRPDTSSCPEVDLEQLDQQARELAHSHRLAARPGRDRLLARLDGNERILQEAYHRLMLAGRAAGISPAGLWFTENFSRIQELMRSARRDLRKCRRGELPRS